MALTFTTGMTSIDPADSTTDWSPYKITSGGGTPTLSLDTDVQVENTGCISFAPTASKDVGAAFNYYNANSNTVLNLTTAGNEVIGVWLLITSAATIDTFQNGGLYIGVMGQDATPTSSNTWSKWYVAGSDTIKGGWNYYQVDTRKTPSATSNGGATLSTAYRVFFGGLHTSSTARADSFFLDASWYGRPVYKVTGDGSTVADWADFFSDSDTNSNGLILDVNGAYELSCGVQVGDDSQTATTTMTDATGQKVNWRRHTYYSAGTVDALTYADYYKLSAEGAASFGTSLTLGSLVGTDQGILGGELRSLDPTNVPVIVDFDTDQSHITALNMYGVVWSGLNGAFDLGANSAFNYYSNQFVGCGQVDPNGGCEIRNCFFIDTSSTTGALLWNSSIDIEDCQFIANTTGEGIEHSSITGVYTGTADDPGSSTTVLSDAGATFTAGMVGQYAYNEADDCYAKITVFDSTTQLTHEALTGGTADDWANGDNYSISPAVAYTDLLFTGNTSDVTNSAANSDGLFISKTGASNPSTATGNVVFIGSVAITVTVRRSDTKAVLPDARVHIYLTSDYSTVVMSEDANGSGVASTTWTGATGGIAIEGWAREMNVSGTDFATKEFSGSIESGGFAVTVELDPLV